MASKWRIVGESRWMIERGKSYTPCYRSESIHRSWARIRVLLRACGIVRPLALSFGSSLHRPFQSRTRTHTKPVKSRRFVASATNLGRATDRPLLPRKKKGEPAASDSWNIVETFFRTTIEILPNQFLANILSRLNYQFNFCSRLVALLDEESNTIVRISRNLESWIRGRRVRRAESVKSQTRFYLTRVLLPSSIGIP